jgi:hypothetical protein
MGEYQEQEVAKTVSLDFAFAAISCAAFLYAFSWIAGCSAAPSRKSPAGAKPTRSHELLRQPEDDRVLSTISGRRLTIDKITQRAATSLQYSNEEYGVAFDAPKGYLLKEGELPSMDRGLGYLGPIPMHFAGPGGMRLATVEPPQGVHLGTNFVNEFFSISVHYGSTQTVCSDFNIPSESRGAPVTRIVDGIEFHGFAEHAAASMHEYHGIYLHAYSNETCYEIGYGVATAGSSASANLKNINEENTLHKLQRFLDNLRINPPDFERATAID